MLKKISYLAITVFAIYIAYCGNKFICNYGPYALSLIKKKYMPIAETDHSILTL
jgi:hypothetical protein